MYINKSTKVMISACAFLFLLAGVFHYMDLHIDDLPFRLSCISYLAYLTVDILCIFYCRKNIPQPSSIKFIIMGVSLLMFWEVVTMLEQMMFPQADVANRVLWYLYYVAVPFVPNLLLMAILYFNLHPKQKINRAWNLTFLVSFILMVLVLTNDYHHKAFGFPEGIDNFYKSYTYGSFYFMIMGWMFFLFVLSFIIMVYRTGKDRKQKLALAPIFAILLSAGYFVWYITGMRIIPWFNDMYGVPEVFHGILISCLGLCVSLGLIKANFNFAEFFEASDISATLVDVNGITKYQTSDIIEITDEQKEAAIDKAVYIDENHRLHSNKINAGHVFWINDMSSITKVNKDLREVKTRLEQDNELLRAENDMVARKAKADEQNRLYAMMTRSVEPQLKEIEKLINEVSSGAPDFKKRLAKACVYNAYVKRYCNLILLAQESRTLHSSELEYSLNESLTYIELNGVPSRLTVLGEGNFNADVLIFAYRVFQALIEENRSNIKQILIELGVSEKEKRIRTLDLKLYIAAKKRKPYGFDNEELSAYEREALSRGGRITSRRNGGLLYSHIEIPESFGEGVYI